MAIIYNGNNLYKLPMVAPTAIGPKFRSKFMSDNQPIKKIVE
jgi:hypothetical protein